MSRILERKIKSYLKNYYSKALKESREEDDVQAPNITNPSTQKQIEKLRASPTRRFDIPDANPFTKEDPNKRYRKHRSIESDENSALDVIDKVKRYGMAYEIGCIRSNKNKNDFIWFLYKKGNNEPKRGIEIDTQSLSNFKKVPHIIRDRSRDGEFRVFNPMVLITSPAIEDALMKHIRDSGPINSPIIRHVDHIDKKNLTIISREKSLDDFIDYDKLGIENPNRATSEELSAEYKDVVDDMSDLEIEDNKKFEERMQKLGEDLETYRKDLIDLNKYIKSIKNLPRKTPQDREEFQKNLDAKKSLEDTIERLSDTIKYSKPPKRGARTYKRNYTINTSLQDDIDYSRYGVVEYLGFSRKADAESIHRHYVRFAHKMLERGPDSESNIASAIRNVESNLIGEDSDKFIVDHFPVEDPEMTLENAAADEEIQESLDAYKEVLRLGCDLLRLEEWIAIQGLASTSLGTGSSLNVKKVLYHLKQDLFSLFTTEKTSLIDVEKLRNSNGLKELTILLAYIGLVVETNKLKRAFKIKSQRSQTEDTLRMLEKLKKLIQERNKSLTEYEFSSSYDKEDDTLGVAEQESVTDPSEAYPEDILNGVKIVRSRLETIRRMRKEEKPKAKK